MNEEIRMRNKKEDRKKLGVYLVILVCCTLGGGVIGAAIGFGEDTGFLNRLAETVTNALLSASIYANLIMAVFTGIFSMILQGKCRALFKIWNPDVDEEEDRLLYRMNMMGNIQLLIVGIVQILMTMFMALGFLQMDRQDLHIIGAETEVICYWAGLVLCAVVVMTVQQKVANFTKELNPEKQGSVFDKNFQKIWLESCDEAEKKAVYESAFASYKATTIACIALWLICICGNLTFDWGIPPVIMVTIIWLTSSVSYCIKAMQIEKTIIRK